RRLAVLPRRTLALAAIAAVALVVAVVLISSGGDNGPPAVSGTPAEVVVTVDAFQKALAERDFAAICDGLFSAEARVAAGGDNCQSVLAQAAAQLRAPRVEITSVTVGRGRAVVGVVASAAGQRPAPDVIRLVREGGRFRIASAGSATGGG
ncbi:MAG: hypothetical protein QOK25_445, partial [Thermoleophilaceae bacterium]|nr:hypothetical protein [Thermoleophilaceae bacterium]